MILHKAHLSIQRHLIGRSLADYIIKKKPFSTITVWQGYFAGGKLYFADGKLYFAGGNHILRMATVPCGLQLFNCKLKLFFAFE